MNKIRVYVYEIIYPYTRAHTQAYNLITNNNSSSSWSSPTSVCIYRHYFRLKIAQKHDSHMRLYAIGNLSLGHMVWASGCMCARVVRERARGYPLN